LNLYYRLEIDRVVRLEARWDSQPSVLSQVIRWIFEERSGQYSCRSFDERSGQWRIKGDADWATARGPDI